MKLSIPIVLDIPDSTEVILQRPSYIVVLVSITYELPWFPFDLLHVNIVSRPEDDPDYAPIHVADRFP